MPMVFGTLTLTSQSFVPKVRLLSSYLNEQGDMQGSLMSQSRLVLMHVQAGAAAADRSSCAQATPVLYHDCELQYVECHTFAALQVAPADRSWPIAATWEQMWHAVFGEPYVIHAASKCEIYYCRCALCLCSKACCRQPHMLC